MASEYQKTQIVVRSAEQVFSWVSDVSNLPTTYPRSRKLGSRDPPRRASPERRSGCAWGSPIARRPRARATSTSTKASAAWYGSRDGPGLLREALGFRLCNPSRCHSATSSFVG
jgi:hypothetical protein